MPDPLLNPSALPFTDIEDKEPQLRRSERDPTESIIPDDRLPEDDKEDSGTPEARDKDRAGPSKTR